MFEIYVCVFVRVRIKSSFKRSLLYNICCNDPYNCLWRITYRYIWTCWITRIGRTLQINIYKSSDWLFLCANRHRLCYLYRNLTNDVLEKKCLYTFHAGIKLNRKTKWQNITLTTAAHSNGNSISLNNPDLVASFSFYPTEMYHTNQNPQCNPSSCWWIYYCCIQIC